MCTREPRLVLVSLLIGWKRGARILKQSLSEVMQNQSNSLITFDTQLKTALLLTLNWKPLYFKCQPLILGDIVHGNQIKHCFSSRWENRSRSRRKTSRCRGEKQQTQPTYDAESGNRTRAILVGDTWSHHCASSAYITDDELTELIVFLSCYVC